MFSWGEEVYNHSFRLKRGSSSSSAATPSAAGVRLLSCGFHIQDLSAGQRGLAFVKDSGDASIILREEESGHTGRQKFVRCEEKLRSVCCSDDQVVFLSRGGLLLCVDPSLPPPYTPSSPESLRGLKVSQVSCGSRHAVALTSDGQVYTWGQNSRGQLGVRAGSCGVSSPKHILLLSAMPLVRVAAGGEQSFGLCVSGSVFSWGRNDRGQLGLGDTADRHKPSPVRSLNMKKTVFIACGQEHTAALTKDGVLFTFGAGGRGQLGHNSLRNEPRPRLVAELWGARVTKVSCGRHHTLVLTEGGKVYSFGCNERGQLGRARDTPASVPLPVLLPKGPTNNLVVDNIHAAGDCSFATCRATRGQEQKDPSNEGEKDPADPPAESLVDRWISGCNSKQWTKIKREIHSSFSSASWLNRSFLSQRDHLKTSGTSSGLDLSLAYMVFKKLAAKEVISAEVESAVLSMLASLRGGQPGVEGLRLFLILNELLHARGRRSSQLAQRVAAALQSLSAKNLQTLGHWWTSLPPQTMTRHARAWTASLSVVLSETPAPWRAAKGLLFILELMYNANERKRRIPASTFHLQFSEAFLYEDVDRWRFRSLDGERSSAPALFTRFPFLFDLKSKQNVLNSNSQVTQMAQLELYFDLHLNRVSLVEDAFNRLAAASAADVMKPLSVFFDGNTEPSNVYTKDFFHHFFLKVTSVKPHMFMSDDTARLVWFSSRVAEAEEHMAEVYLFGLLCGMALYNNHVVHLPFPLALFKKLLGVRPALEDMKEFDPQVGRCLEYILNYEDDDLEEQYFFFEITWDEVQIDLDPSDPGKPVTTQNKEEFVDAYVDYAFNKSVEGVFREFERGFFQLCDRDLLRIFQPAELREVMVGNNDYDWETFKKNTQYELPLANDSDMVVAFDTQLDHPVLRMFWEVFEELSEEQKRDFLWFLTGFRRVPVLGMSAIKMRVQLQRIPSGSHDEHFPKTLTCHSILQLPSYSSADVMRARLTEAVKAERLFSE